MCLLQAPYGIGIHCPGEVANKGLSLHAGKGKLYLHLAQTGKARMNGHRKADSREEPQETFTGCLLATSSVSISITPSGTETNTNHNGTSGDSLQRFPPSLPACRTGISPTYHQRTHPGTMPDISPPSRVHPNSIARVEYLGHGTPRSTEKENISHEEKA